MAKLQGMLPVFEGDGYVIDILDAREVEMVSTGACGKLHGWAPAWAVGLARAEEFDRFDARGRKAFKWPAVWRMASADTDWQKATATLALLDGSTVQMPDELKFFRAWVDMWLYRKNSVRAYPPDMIEGATLKRIVVPGGT